jgi:hypothetical protein
MLPAWKGQLCGFCAPQLAPPRNFRSRALQGRTATPHDSDVRTAFYDASDAECFPDFDGDASQNPFDLPTPEPSPSLDAQTFKDVTVITRGSPSEPTSHAPTAALDFPGTLSTSFGSMGANDGAAGSTRPTKPASMHAWQDGGGSGGFVQGFTRARTASSSQSSVVEDLDESTPMSSNGSFHHGTKESSGRIGAAARDFPGNFKVDAAAAGVDPLAAGPDKVEVVFASGGNSAGHVVQCGDRHGRDATVELRLSASEEGRGLGDHHSRASGSWNMQGGGETCSSNSTSSSIDGDSGRGGSCGFNTTTNISSSRHIGRARRSREKGVSGVQKRSVDPYVQLNANQEARRAGHYHHAREWEKDGAVQEAVVDDSKGRHGRLGMGPRWRLLPKRRAAEPRVGALPSGAHLQEPGSLAAPAVRGQNILRRGKGALQGSTIELREALESQRILEKQAGDVPSRVTLRSSGARAVGMQVEEEEVGVLSHATATGPWTDARLPKAVRELQAALAPLHSASARAAVDVLGRAQASALCSGLGFGDGGALADAAAAVAAAAATHPHLLDVHSDATSALIDAAASEPTTYAVPKRAEALAAAQVQLCYRSSTFAARLAATKPEAAAATLLPAAAALAPPSPELWQRLLRAAAAAAAAGVMHPTCIAACLHACAQARARGYAVEPEVACEERAAVRILATAATQPLLPHTPATLTRTLTALYALQLRPSSRQRSELLHLVHCRSLHMSAQEAVTTARCLAHLRIIPHGSPALALLDALERTAPDMNAVDTAMAWWAVGRMRLLPEATCRTALLAAARREAPQMSQVGAATTLWAWGRLATDTEAKRSQATTESKSEPTRANEAELPRLHTPRSQHVACQPHVEASAALPLDAARARAALEVKSVVDEAAADIVVGSERHGAPFCAAAAAAAATTTPAAESAMHPGTVELTDVDSDVLCSSLTIAVDALSPADTGSTGVHDVSRPAETSKAAELPLETSGSPVDDATLAAVLLVLQRTALELEPRGVANTAWALGRLLVRDRDTWQSLHVAISRAAPGLSGAGVRQVLEGISFSGQSLPSHAINALMAATKRVAPTMRESELLGILSSLRWLQWEVDTEAHEWLQAASEMVAMGDAERRKARELVKGLALAVR